MSNTGSVSVSVLAGPIDVAPIASNERIGQQIRMGDDFFFHIKPDVARQWISVLETIAEAAE
ncbi:hypothetical protein AB0O52_17465 [Arthrobacter sp. NPDC080073]|uniref:hypothetical protein n=1 Tax=Arthrobacter sp. NPDC080073 TaxID=3155919 RepID=UPI003448B93F